MNALLLESEDVAWFRDDLTGARLAASRLARRIGLSEHRAGEIALAVSEAASNLVKHAVAGAILLRVVRTAQHGGIEFLALDSGPGMADVAASMRDGRSTAGTLGIGLGMVARLADTFDLHSLPGHGTVMLARFWPRDARLRPAVGGERSESAVGGVTRPIGGAQECGDGWAARWDDAGTPVPGDALRDVTAAARIRASDRSTPGYGGGPAAGPAAGRASAALGAGRAVLVMLCDGLGHGPLAEMATQVAIRAFHTGAGGHPEEVVNEIHHALASTRGAAVAVARIEPDQERVLFCGVGNIAGAVVTSTSKSSLPSLPGTAGHLIRTLRTFTHPMPTGSALVMHSDGLTERWSPETLPGVLQHSPTVIAGHLLRIAGKYHDDASVVVAKGPW
ncbi:Anti-sigma regulatory factor (Ser/Thr protein kinase) [Streptomyces sp. DvalAA-14]|uniref:ATP-binding SpoIIE family protein phosphatase n=1 Tax=unclassified Streptomyces TaxID=2593676 RepID=UPI00081B193D|nr:MULTISPECIES: ATP-binding SpoIIE family protein phosphatase [unclassified Streptomyces]MYS23627.1 SpoIIE family protein phosphatase [Streptomyces sp. SID4948]SCE36416.1 Anti-sigma regulatory factor (Ser/Thr protein kinase) [Streptomyces sp. DvalAA-14]